MWAKPLARRSGAVSVWQAEEDLRRFIEWPVHVEIMGKYRPVAKMSSVSWEVERFVAEEVWRQARNELSHPADGGENRAAADL
jgi:hypothetical protein